MPAHERHVPIQARHTDNKAVSRSERLFRIAMAVKGLDGLIEVVGGLTLLLVSQAEVQKVIAAVVTRDLLGPPDGSLARHFVAGTAEFASGNRTFAVLYLLLHGVLKVGLVVALLRHWLPAYPVAIVVLGLFVVYELYRATQTGSVLLPVLAVVDVAVIALVVREYRALRRAQSGARGSVKDSPRP
jgi:uncharacterized membrane protein